LTRSKVKDLAEALEYEPNSNAVELGPVRSNILGIHGAGLDNFFYDTFIAA
jgi:DNA-binding LacI/PurR family transcriptional regulator